MRDESNFRGFAFVTLSGICHGFVIAALGLIPAAGLIANHLQPVEVSMEGDVVAQETLAEQAPVTQAEPSAKPAPPVVAVAPAAAPAPAPLPAKKPTPSKVVKVYAPAGLPKAKPVVQTKNSEPKSEDMVAVAPVEKEEMTPDVSEEDLKPVEEAAPEEATEKVEEESAQETAEEIKENVVAAKPTEQAQPVEEAKPVSEAKPAPDAKPVAPASTGTTGATGANNAVVPSPAPAPGAATRSYLDLKQKPGNRAPDYPLEARRAGRQGQLELMYFVTREGRVSQIKIVKSTGSKDLDDEAIRTIAQYRYVPGQEGWTKHPVLYSLKGQAVEAPGRLRTMGAKGG